MNNNIKKSMTPYAAIVLGGFSGALIVYISSFPNIGSLFIGYFTALPIFLITLSLGKKIGLGSTLFCAALLQTIVGFQAAAIYLCIIGLPTVYFSSRFLLSRFNTNKELDWYPIGKLAVFLCLFSVFLILGFNLFLTTQDTNIDALIRSATNIFLASSPNATAIKPIVSKIISFVPAFFSLSWFFMISVNAILAQNILERFSKNMRLVHGFKDMDLPRWYLQFFVISIAIASFADGQIAFFAKNIALISLAPFFLFGLSLIHRFFHSKFDSENKRFIALILFYVLIFIMIWLIILITAYAVVEILIQKYIMPILREIRSR